MWLHGDELIQIVYAQINTHRLSSDTKVLDKGR